MERDQLTSMVTVGVELTGWRLNSAGAADGAASARWRHAVDIYKVESRILDGNGK